MVVTSIGSEYQFRQVPSWDPVRSFQWEVASYPGWVAFSPDGRLVALELSPAVISLLDARTGAEIAKLQDPSSDRASWIGFTGDSSRLVTIAQYSKVIHVWDLGMMDRELQRLGLAEGFTSLAPRAGHPPRQDGVKIVLDTSESAEFALELEARHSIARHQQALAARPDNAGTCNSLAWIYATAPEKLRDSKECLALAQRAAALEPANALYRNTLGVAYYRAGRYSDAVQVLLANLEGQDDRFLPWDLYFLAMSFARLGNHDRAREYRNWALRWSRDQNRLDVENLRELSALRDEMEATLKSAASDPARSDAPPVKDAPVKARALDR
jgi:tetratricopeptide (TPR) repeat protein